jgi:hypothetical protein
MAEMESVLLSRFESAHSDENIYGGAAWWQMKEGIAPARSGVPAPHRFSRPREIWFATPRGRAFFDPSRSFLSQL